ncbi:MAG: U32 family peptidase [Paludibacteraceae bacterium]|nr:U32 family peptidase [Paludibacteraceae bacterium]
MRMIELLSPAKTAEHGIEAINHGADAVYIGAPQFSARANASNSINEIERLVSYAHKYYAKVYVALNTILTDEELGQTERIIHQLYNIGTDALIIQDLGILELNIPPIAIHASTQMDNRSVEKVKFLEQAGFEQVVLARELTIDQIKEIHSQTNVRLEGFVHGALCVSYSGQCYLSQSLCGRSANRGVCAQMCRLPYSLIDGKGDVLVKDKFLLSLKDFNLSNYLKELIDAGITSLKIEGRLKDINYVKNVTAYYRQQLDNLLNGKTQYQQASSGKCTYTFTPNIEKSFHRGSTDYFLHGRNHNIFSFDTPKSLGEVIGKVTQSNARSITIETKQTLNNGDGFCYLNTDGQFYGFKANTAEGNRITPAERVFIKPGTLLYRNFDQHFESLLSKKSAERKIRAAIVVKETEDGIQFILSDEDKQTSEYTLHDKLEEANQPEKQLANIQRTLSKSGDTSFEIEKVDVETSKIYFIPASTLAEIRRELIDQLERRREGNRQRSPRKIRETHHAYIQESLDYRGNVHNQKAKEFYQKHQVSSIDDSFEKKEPAGAELMRCKHCIKYALGYCTKENGKRLNEPLYLVTNTQKKIQLHFDCKNCEMVLKKL